ncbi:MAG: DUF2917 domain-containing protein [Anaerolineales bacterium]|nr:DUF2917 domain-containing protein [Anaerolineales bacterium]
MTGTLANHSQKALVVQRGSEICCLEGMLWITLEGDLKDHIIAAGETFVANHKGKVVLQALNLSSIFSLN